MQVPQCTCVKFTRPLTGFTRFQPAEECPLPLVLRATGLLDPYDLAVDNGGNVLVAEAAKNRIAKISTAGVLSVVAGHPAGTAGFKDGMGTLAWFSSPRGVCIDSNGNIFVSDFTNNAIRKIAPSRIVTTFAGAASSDGFTGRTELAVVGPLYIATDISDNLYFTESNRVRKITPTGTMTILAGSLAGTAGNVNAQGTSASFNNAQGIAVNSAGFVYVASYLAHEIRMISPAGVVTTIAGKAAIAGNIDGLGSNARLYSPLGMAIDNNGHLFFADFSNNKYKKITICAAGSIYDSVNKRCTVGSCPAGSTYNAGTNTCIYTTCGPGYELISSNCNECHAGSVKNTTGSMACTDCPIGTEPDGDRAACVVCSSNYYRSSLADSSCIACPENSICSATNFTCSAGFRYNNDTASYATCEDGDETCIPVGACERCPSGTEVSAFLTSCIACSGNKYRPVNATSCINCVSNASCNSTSFQCNPGYTLSLDGASCVLCADGYFKNSISNQACSTCPIGTETTVNNRSSCTNCSIGKYRPSLNYLNCISCPSNASCTATVFTCNAGYQIHRANDGCEQCPLGYYKLLSGNGECSVCPIGSESAADRLSYIACPTKKYRASLTYNKCVYCPGEAICNVTHFVGCNPGYRITAEGDACQACPYDYESASNGLSCVPCLPGYGRPDLHMPHCLDNSTLASSVQIVTMTLTETQSTTLTQTTHHTQTQTAFNTVETCSPGTTTFYSTATQVSFSTATQAATVLQTVLVAMPTSSSCSAGMYLDAVNGRCISCPLNADCTGGTLLCNAGYEPSANGFDCVNCPHGKFKDISGNSKCQPCPLNEESDADRKKCNVCPSDKHRPSADYPVCVLKIDGVQSQSNSVNVEFIGSLPISPLTLVGITFALGCCLMLLIMLLCRCRIRSKPSDVFEPFFNTVTSGNANTATGGTFTTTGSRR